MIWSGLKKKKPLYNWSQVVQQRGQTLRERVLDKETNKYTQGGCLPSNKSSQVHDCKKWHFQLNY